MLRQLFFAIAVAFCVTSFAAAQGKGDFLNDLDFPSPGEVDNWDYNLYIALHPEVGYAVNEYSLEGELLNTWEHDNLVDALDQKDFLETRMMMLYDIEEFEYPQTWFYWGHFDFRMDAEAEARELRSLGLDTDIRRVTQWTKMRKR